MLAGFIVLRGTLSFRKDGCVRGGHGRTSPGTGSRQPPLRKWCTSRSRMSRSLSLIVFTPHPPTH